MSTLQFPPFISAFFQGLHKIKKQRSAREQKHKDLQKLFFQRMVNESKKQKKTSEHVIQVMKSS